MRTLATALVALSLLAVAVSSLADEGKTKRRVIETEMKKLQGTWKARSYESEHGINNSPRADFKLEKDSFALWIGHGGIRGKIVIDPGLQPKTLDLRFTFKGKQEVFRCIYEWDGDCLRLCFGESETKRPAAFPKKGDKKVHFGIYVFERVKN
jgi:uncharacterized protein (TIGR03067 family)